MALFAHSGWNTSTIGPGGLASRRVVPPPAPVTPQESTVGPATALASTLATPSNIIGLQPTGPRDAALGSRGTLNTQRRSVAIQVSPYQTRNVPEFLNSAIAELNTNQSLRRAQHAELIDRLFGEAMTGNLAAWDALRAASVQPGAHVQLSPLVDPNVGLGYAETARAAAAQQAAQTAAVRAAQMIPSQIASLESQRARLGQSAFGTYQGSAQQRLDRQLTDLYTQQSARSATQRLGQSAARASGWTPALPGF